MSELTDLKRKLEAIVSRTDVTTMTENTKTVGNRMITGTTDIAWAAYGAPASKTKRK